MPERRGVFRHAAPRAVAVVLDHHHGSRRRRFAVELEDGIDCAVADGFQKTRFPVGMQSPGPEKVGHGLRRAVRHRSVDIRDRRAIAAQRPQRVFTVFESADPDAAQRYNRFSQQCVRQRHPRRSRKNHHTVAHFFRRGLFKFSPKAHGLAALG